MKDKARANSGVGVACALAFASACSPLIKAGSSTFASKKTAEDAGKSPASLVGAAVRFAPPSVQSNTQFGSVVALDGDTLAVAAPFENIESDGAITRAAGATYVYDLASPGAAPERIVTPNAGTDDGVLPSTVFPQDAPQGPPGWPGLRPVLRDQSLVIGVPGEDSGSTDPGDDSAPEAGAVYVYDRVNGGPPEYLKAPAPRAGEVYGHALALSDPWLAVGAPGTADRRGAVYVYHRNSNGLFDQPPQTVVAPVPDAGDWFGGAMAINDDLLVVGAPMEDGSGMGTAIDGSASDQVDNASQNSGAAYVFRLSGGEWKYERYLKLIATGQNGPKSGFGSYVALSGSRIVVGAPSAVGCPTNPQVGSNRGAAYVIDSTDWTEDCLDPSSKGVGVLFGWGLAAQGDQVIVSAPWDESASKTDPTNVSIEVAGAVYVFEPGSQGWTSRSYVKPPHIEAAAFGFFVTTTPGRLAVGAPYEPAAPSDSIAPRADGGEPESGAVYVFPLAD